MKNIILATGTALGLALLLPSCASAETQQAEAEKPKLILQITVDQLRGDLPTRYYDRLGEGGFRYLWENGVEIGRAHV